MKVKIFFVALAVVSLSVGSVQAQIVKHEKYQHHRIKQGVRSGELTPEERRKLALQQRDIHHDTRAARADGVVTPMERKEIREDQKKASHSIYRKKHNYRTRK